MSGERPRILVVDDEPDNLNMFVRVLRKVGDLTTATCGTEALEQLRQGSFAVVVTDHLMPGLTGVELLERAARIAPATERILVSAHGDVEMLTEAINRGHVSHFVPKPFEPDVLRQLVSRAVATAPAETRRALLIASGELSPLVAAALRSAGLSVCVSEDHSATSPDDVVVWPSPVTTEVLDEVRRSLRVTERVRRHRSELSLREMIGRSSAMQRLFEEIERVAPTDATVLIRGETGTGKELVARVVHSLSPRREQPFVAVNCAALPETLVESELFGHERGAFTGAQTRKQGRFERADGGTLFVDEVGDVPEAVQVKLLRVLQERCFERIGGSETLNVDIRLIAATNIDLEQAIAEGNFREDLFYRLNVVPLYLPPLRERREDIPLLVDHMLTIFQRRLGKESIRIAPAMARHLQEYDWPGNVRELMNLIERVVALTPSGGVADLSTMPQRSPRPMLSAMVPESSSASLADQVKEFERRVIVHALERCGGNRTRAAKDLGLTRQGLSQKIRRYGL
jgi:DNA-binding NtrC family response regulator